MNSQPATEKQIAFINTLIAERLAQTERAAQQNVSPIAFPQSLKDKTLAAVALWKRIQLPENLSKQDASDLISFLKNITAAYDLLDAQNDDYFSIEFNSIVKLLLSSLKPEPEPEPPTSSAVSSDDAALNALAEIAAEFDVLFGTYYLARIGEELVLAINTLRKLDMNPDDEFDYRAREFGVCVYHATGASEQWVTQIIPKGQNQGKLFPEPTQLRVPVKRSTYERFYDLWAETGADETIRARRRSMVKMNWIAVDMPDLSGGY